MRRIFFYGEAAKRTHRMAGTIIGQNKNESERKMGRIFLLRKYYQSLYTKILQFVCIKNSTHFSFDLLLVRPITINYTK